MPNRIEIIPETDSRFILLRIDRVLLGGFLLVLVFIASVHTFGIVQSIKSDDRLVQEQTELRKDVDTARQVIDNANETSKSSVEFLRCAFLIEPDVDKSPQVIDGCIEQAEFPSDPRR